MSEETRIICGTLAFFLVVVVGVCALAVLR